MPAFLFALTLVLFGGGAINIENSGKGDVYADSPKILVQDIGDAVKEAYSTDEPILQAEYNTRFND